MNLTIVIPCVNLWSKYTRPCLDSLRTIHSYRVVLVDNGSTDETRTEASRLVSATFHHRRYEYNFGIARSWNWGIVDGFEKDAAYVAVLNNDVLLHPDCLDRMVARMERQDLALVSGLDVRGETRAPEDVFQIPTDAKTELAESEHPNFAAFMINRRCWELVGGFDEEFCPAYFEDNDYHYRIGLAGLRAVVYPPAMFYHYGSRTQNEACAAPIVSGGRFDENRRYYERKWGGPPGAELYREPFGRRWGSSSVS